RARRIAVVISAWDLVKESYRIPTDWLKRRLPLLHQFLLANRDRLPFKIFGISAQGAELSEDNSELQRHCRQSERIEVVSDVENEYGKHDITAPVKWVRSTDN